jgi:iron-sulfur cluster repair protein YtfE (RIC family)
MSKSQIRSEIVAEHGELRELLPEVASLAEQFEQAAPGAHDLGRRLREAGLALYQKFAAHMDHEQQLLEPALRAAGAEGERLARRLEHEHHEQRELLDYLLTRLREQPTPTVLIARQLQNFTNFLRFEMDHEEKTLLAPEILRDPQDRA